MSDGSPKANGANGHAFSNDLHHPSPTRARKLNPHIARAFNNELSVNAQRAAAAAAGILSERNTPAPPDDAPPSVKATSAARRANRQATRRRIFPTVDYQERVSYFDPQSSYANFRGFFVLFWIGLAIMVITQMLRNVRETGALLNFRQWPLFTKDLAELGYSDVLMCSSTAVSLPLHLLFVKSKGLLQWERGGIIIQSLYQAAWLWFWIGWPFLRDWTWTAQVFFTLHTLVLFMKMHSYAFYNGHLSDTLIRLKQLDMPIGPATHLNAAVHYPSASFRLSEATPGEDEDKEEPDLSPVLQLREDLAKELTSPMGNVTYPQNLTIANFADYLLCPTLCYELEYPRMPKRSYLELFYKTLAVFGCIFLMTVVSEEFIIPILDESRLRLQRSRTGIDGALMFAEAVSRLLFPFMITFLLVFMVIFEYVLGAFAEITRFADRQFYDDWWNSTDWMEFSREWNIPVHHFFRRHVYSASRGIMSKPAATGLTFLISAIAHELIMGCITRKFRGYGFVLMMLQIPFVAIQQLPFIKRRELLNNSKQSKGCQASSCV